MPENLQASEETDDPPAGAAKFCWAILDSIQDGVYFVDTAGRILYWNAGAESITGHLRQQVIGRYCRDSLLDHCTVEGRPVCGSACPLEATLADGKPRETMLLLRHRNGHRLPVRVRTSPVFDAASKIIGAAEVFEEREFASDTGRQSAKLASLDLLDPLTGLPNHTLMAEWLGERLEEWQRCGVPFGVLLVDVDQLGEVNRKFGRDAGDQILRMAAQTLQKGLAGQHVAGRWETDSFLAILDNCDADTLRATGERVRVMLEQSSVPWWGLPVSVTASIAGAISRPGDTEASLLGELRRRLESMEAGRNQFRMD